MKRQETASPYFYTIRDKEIRTVPENHNVFLTEKACHRHMELNHYHFNQSYSYAQHAFRNPEMEQLYKAIHEIAESEHER